MRPSAARLSQPPPPLQTALAALAALAPVSAPPLPPPSCPNIVTSPTSARALPIALSLSLSSNPPPPRPPRAAPRHLDSSLSPLDPHSPFCEIF